MANRQQILQDIINEARTHAEDGAHYLWGGAGNTPGESDGAAYRPKYTLLHANTPDLVEVAAPPSRRAPFVPTLFAAWAATFDQGNLACSGRAAVVGNLPFALDGIALKDALLMKLKDLKPEQIEEFRKNRGFSWKFRWPRPNGRLETSSGTTSTTWGECCIGRRHFDCIGFVNYCFSKVLNRVWHYGIDNFTKPEYAKSSGFLPVTPISSAKPGDILTNLSVHIGIVTEKGTTIEAKDPAHGVIELPVSKGPWTNCWRVPDGGLRQG